MVLSLFPPPPFWLSLGTCGGLVFGRFQSQQKKKKKIEGGGRLGSRGEKRNLP